MPQNTQYSAFISYSHTDEKWAKWIQRRIENYYLPGTSTLRRTTKPPLAPTFMDRSDFASAADLSEAAHDALNRSNAMVVICSPEAAQSRWVNEEVKYFRQKSRDKNVFSLIVSGEPFATNPDEECFPEPLKHVVDEQGELTSEIIEPLAADVRPHADGKRAAALKIIAGLLQVPFDDLQRRQHRRAQQRLVLTAVGAGLLATVMTVLAITAYFSRAEAELRRAQADDLISFMLTDLRKRLEPLGRLDVLDDVNDEAMDYLASLPENESSRDALLPHAMTLRQIGEVRNAQGNLDAARTSFLESKRILVTADAQFPQDAEIRFELAQAHFWVADIYFQQNEFDAAQTEIEEYARIAASLAAQHPTNQKYLLEEFYATSNLATLAFNRSRFEKARQGFERAREMIEQMAAATPDDPGLRAELAGTFSWLASVHTRLHDLNTSLDMRLKQLEIMQQEATERDKTSMRRLGDSLRLASAERYRLGDTDGAMVLSQQALSLFDSLVQHDPANQIWLLRLASSQTDVAGIYLSQRNLPSADRQLKDATGTLQTVRRALDNADSRHRFWSNELLVANFMRISGDTSASSAKLQVIYDALHPENLSNRSERTDYYFAVAGYLLAEALFDAKDPRSIEIAQQTLHWFDTNQQTGIDLYATLFALSLAANRPSAAAGDHLVSAGYRMPAYWTHTRAARKLQPTN